MRIVAVLISAILSTAPAEARQIATDLSSHHIEITAGFEGAELLLFGHETNAEDILVIVRGPDQPATIRRKERFAGIWVNQTEVTFSATPGFYYVAVTPGLKADGRLDTILAETGLGARYLGLTALGETQLVETFRKALIELRGRSKLYSTEPDIVQIRPDGLFRVTVPFPASTPVGDYSVTVYQIIDGWPIAGATTPLRVQKAGFSAFVFDLAHGTPFIYGLVAITIALSAGWLGGLAFRRG
jgi:uncharacterized protein (TIGR02186 family)